MLEAIAETLKIMGVLGIVLFILAGVNIITGTIINPSIARIATTAKSSTRVNPLFLILSP